MNTSEQLTEFAKAMTAAQAEIMNPVKNAENPHFKSNYVDLAGGLDEVRPVLARNGLAILQTTGMDGEFMMLTTRLLHTSGQWIESIYPVCKFPARQQEVGSALTYARRYSLFSMAGIAGADDDDDANEASKEKTPAPTKRSGVTVVQDPAQASVFLMEVGRKFATDGMVELGKWWKSLDPKQRALIEDENGGCPQELKDLAAKEAA